MAAVLSTCGGAVRLERLFGASNCYSLPANVFSGNSSDSKKKHHYRLTCAAQDLPAEIRDDPKFVPLSKDDPGYGTTAMLLVGFQREEMAKVEDYLRGMDAEFVNVILCDKRMLRMTLWNCMHTSSSSSSSSSSSEEEKEVAQELPRICFLSGMTGEEIMTIVQTFPEETGLEDTAFAALVPKNAQSVLEQVIEEVIGDHERLKKE